MSLGQVKFMGSLRCKVCRRLNCHLHYLKVQSNQWQCSNSFAYTHTDTHTYTSKYVHVCTSTSAKCAQIAAINCSIQYLNPYKVAIWRNNFPFSVTERKTAKNGVEIGENAATTILTFIKSHMSCAASFPVFLLSTTFSTTLSTTLSIILFFYSFYSLLQLAEECVCVRANIVQ